MTTSSSQMDKLAFFHVGKTGGSSLASLLVRSSPGQNWIQSHPEDFSYNTKINDLSLICGHLPIRSHISNFNEYWKTCTIFRNPITHIPSVFYHAKLSRYSENSEEGHRLNARIIAETLEEYLSRPEKTAISQSLFDNPQTRFVLDKPFGLLEQSDIDDAKEIIDKIDIVGVLERSQHLLLDLKSIMKWDILEKLPNINTNPQNSFNAMTMSAKTINLISSITEFDDDIYRHTLKRHNKFNEKTYYSAPQSTRSSINLADAIRVGNITVENAQWGSEAMIYYEQVILHPCKGQLGSASLSIDNFRLDGQQELSFCAILPDIQSLPVEFSITIKDKNRSLSAITVVVNPGENINIKVNIEPFYGITSLCFKTKMCEMGENYFSTAIFDKPYVS